MKHFWMRCVYLFTSWGIVGMAYHGSAYLQHEPSLLSPSIIDKWIEFTPHAIWAYLSFFLIIPICFFIAPYRRLGWMSGCFVLSGILAALCYLIFPTTMIYPVDNGSSISSWLLVKLIEIDDPVNCFPSLHVTLTSLAIWGALNKFHPLRNIILLLWGMTIVLSIIQLRRHLFIDFIGGTVLALIAGWSVQYGFKRVIKQS